MTALIASLPAYLGDTHEARRGQTPTNIECLVEYLAAGPVRCDIVPNGGRLSPGAAQPEYRTGDRRWEPTVAPETLGNGCEIPHGGQTAFKWRSEPHRPKLIVRPGRTWLA
jgi:hypothetical protein